MSLPKCRLLGLSSFLAPQIEISYILNVPMIKTSEYLKGHTDLFLLIRHRAFRHVRACLIPLLSFVKVFLLCLIFYLLFSSSLMEPHGITRKPRAPLFTPFLYWFSECPFNTERSLKISEPGPKTTRNNEIR